MQRKIKTRHRDVLKHAIMVIFAGVYDGAVAPVKVSGPARVSAKKTGPGRKGENMPMIFPIENDLSY